MPILLHRVDERLIHGQVVLGWGGELRAGRYLVVDDDLAANEWEQDLYRLSVPDEVEVVFADVATARKAHGDWAAEPVRSVLLTRDVSTMAALGVGGLLAGTEINLGGIHHRPGRSEVRSYLFLDDDDRAAIRALVEAGADVSGRDLPASPRAALDQLLG